MNQLLFPRYSGAHTIALLEGKGWKLLVRDDGYEGGKKV